MTTPASTEPVQHTARVQAATESLVSSLEVHGVMGRLVFLRASYAAHEATDNSAIRAFWLAIYELCCALDEEQPHHRGQLPTTRRDGPTG